MGKKGRKGAPTLLSTQLITGRLRWAKCVHFIDGRDRGNQELSDPRASFLSFFVVRVSWTHNSSSFHHLALYLSFLRAIQRSLAVLSGSTPLLLKGPRENAAFHQLSEHQTSRPTAGRTCLSGPSL